MIEFIDYEKRLTCEEHIVLLYYSLMYKKKHANYSEFQITELLIDEYNLDNNQEKRSEVEKMVERKKEDLDKFRVDYAQKIWDYEKPVIWSDRKKTDYYIEQLNKSHRFEVYVDYLFRQSGYDIGLFYGKNQQYRQGETAAGIEIKCDMKLQETGNVYIEYQERITKDGEWVDSGILKKDETRYFLIGTVEKFYILPRTKLQSYYNRLVKYGEKLSGMRLVEEKEHQTSKRFIMSKRRAEQDSLTVEEVVNILKNE